jgi:hypothetical protein
MRRLTRVAIAVGVLMFAAASAANAQTGGGFNAGYMDIGPVIGLGGINGASLSYGARFEYGIEELPSLGNGVLSFAASLDHYSYDNGCGGSCSFGFSYTPIGATVNYHFRLDNRQLDPFFGLGLGDEISSASCNSSFCNSSLSASSGIYFIGRLGLRYYVAPSLALYADVGSGQGAFHIGVMFKLASGK